MKMFFNVQVDILKKPGIKAFCYVSLPNASNYKTLYFFHNWRPMQSEKFIDFVEFANVALCL